MCSANSYQKSGRAFQQASKFMPGGVNSPVRAFGGVGFDPLFIESAKGSKIYDIDGNSFIDYVGSWGPMILGHAHPKVVKAITEAAKKGTSFGAPTMAENELAKKIVSAFDSIDKVRLLSSGTEAVMTAIRLARGYTKKEIIIKMTGCYHGHSDSLLVAAGSGLAESGTASSAGVPACLAELTCVIPYNDTDALEEAFEKHKGNIAAVLVEPIAANMGVIPPEDGYLQTIRNLCDDESALLIFDEVITGFRVALGGAQEIYTVKADITCLGKIIGGGLPAAAIGGNAKVINTLAPTGPVYQAGTLSGNPLATAAANATIDILRQKDSYRKLDNAGSALQNGLSRAAAEAKIPVELNRIGSLMSCFFTDKNVTSFEDVKNTNEKHFKMFFSQMLRQGVYMAPSRFEAMFISLAHSREDIDKTVSAAEKSFYKIKKQNIT